jgi:PAS domain S-box-containing protein
MFVKVDGQEIETLKIFDSLIDNFPDMIHSVDEQGNIVYFNRTATHLLGYAESELQFMNIRQLYPPEILDAVEKGFREVKATGEKRVESLFLAKDGTRIPVELRTLVLRDEHGAFSQTFTVSRDLRNLKEMQENLIHAGRLAAIGELAAGVVHDLNNPLTAVILASTILKKVTERPDTPPEQLREQASAFCETINESAATMENLTTRLRDFSRGVKEQHTLVDLFDPITDALFILAHRVRHANIAVSCPVVKSKHWVLGDRNQIQQVFLNLFANACDAMAKCDTRELSITVDAYTNEGTVYWRCAVSDTGEGIPPEIQDRVFKSFFTTKPRGKGTGLGLSITRSILKEHNGNIALTSEPGQGATFYILLPSLGDAPPA